MSLATSGATAPTSNTDPAAVAAAIASPNNTLTKPPVIPATVPVTAVKAPNATFARYATVLFTAIITIGSAAQILPAHHTAADLIQFGVVVAGAVGAIFSRVNLRGWWPGVFKTGAASLAAVGTLLVPYLAGGASFTSITPTNWIIFGVAAVQAVAVEMGVQIRTTANLKTEENLLK